MVCILFSLPKGTEGDVQGSMGERGEREGGRDRGVAPSDMWSCKTHF